MKIKNYKNNDEVEKKYRWDLDFLLENKTLDFLMNDILNMYKKIIVIKDSKFESSENYLNSLKFEDKLILAKNKLENYLSNKKNENILNHEIKAFIEKYNFEFYQLSQKLGSEINRFFDNAKKIKKWIKEPKFLDYRNSIEKTLILEKHILPKKIQEFQILSSRADTSLEEIFSILTNSELDYGYAYSQGGKKIKITLANRALLSKNKDSKIRKTSFLGYRNAFLKHKSTLSNLLYQHFKKIVTTAKIHKYSSTINYLLFDDQVSEKLLNKLYKGVQNNIKIFKPYIKYRKQFFKKKFKMKMTKYDWNVDLIEEKSQYSIEKCKELVIASIEPFGEEYANVVKKALENNWVDFMPVKNKVSGAYSIGSTYGVDKKLILMNYDGTFNSLETLAHEMGHSMHSYFSDKYQTLRNSAYPIFLAEIASIFNELLLHEHILKTTKDKKLQFMILQKSIDGFMATVLRQVEWSNYEYNLYTQIEKGKPLNSYEDLAKLYYDNSLKYKIKKSKFHLNDQFPAIYVPHFYYDFYVYKYAIGQICAYIFFERYQRDGSIALEKYLDDFLSSGSKKWPLEILKDAGIDLNNATVYEKSFIPIKQKIKNWIKLGKEIFLKEGTKNETII